MNNNSTAKRLILLLFLLTCTFLFLFFTMKSIRSRGYNEEIFIPGTGYISTMIDGSASPQIHNSLSDLLSKYYEEYQKGNVIQGIFLTQHYSLENSNTWVPTEILEMTILYESGESEVIPCQQKK